jgi:hypothetical protein
MGNKLKQLVEGYSKLWKIQDMPDREQKLAEARMEICMNCQYRMKATNTCSKCGCYLPSKTKCMRCTCPKDFW